MIERTGYVESFLGEDVYIPLPKFDLETESQVLRREQLRDGHIVDYIHYSIVMNCETKQAIFSAANIDQSSQHTVSGRRWFIDPRIGTENQIGPSAYSDNPWDRGHLTRRTAITWGESPQTATRASNDSCAYANACLQHANFNQDEWRVPEQAVHHFEQDLNNKLCVYTGPLFTEYDRWFYQSGMEEAVRIPSGFWKIVAYIDRETREPRCQGYVMYQDELFNQDRQGQHAIELANYQVTTTQIERLTGIEFPEVLFENNPLYYYARRGINAGPEVYRTRGVESGVIFSRSDLVSGAFETRRVSVVTKEL